MPTPSPEPPGRPVDPAALPPAAGSTGSHRAAPSQPPGQSLSDLLRAGGSSRRATAAADLAAHLIAHAGRTPTPPPAPAPDDEPPPGVEANTDDSPTVITQQNRQSPLPPPPHVVGGAPSVAGRRLGHFELIEAVGAGGMAAVLKARDQELGRVVALKILPPESTGDPENVARFKSEARAAAKLDHENVARVYFCGEDQGLHFIAFEFVEGINLRQMIDRRGPLPAGECARYMIQVAAGLAHAAERGVVHRDIKPSNVVVTPDGRAKIVDMGLARHLDAVSVNGGVTQSGVTLGTFDYISPEQALDPRRADVRSDLYSLGCTFYHAMTGRPPVPEGTAARKLKAHQFEEPLDPRELNPGVPDAVAAVLAKMMAKDPARRYQTPAELIAHLKSLDALAATAFEASDSVVRAIPAASPLPAAPPRLPLGWAVAGVAVAAAVVAVVAATATPTRAPVRPPWHDTPVKLFDPLASLPVGPQAGPAAGVPPVADGVARPATAAELAKALQDPKVRRVELRADTRYDLTALGEPVEFGGAALELVGDPDAPARVVVAAVPLDPAAPTPPGGLRLPRAETLGVRGVRFGLRSPDPDGVLPPSAGLALGAAAAEFADCVFSPLDDFAAARLPAVSVARPGGEAAPKLTLERCLFLPGAVAVQATGRAELTVRDCGFGSQSAVIQARPDPADADAVAAVDLDRSSFVLGAGSAVVRADDRANARVAAGYCVFGPTVAQDNDRRPVLAAVAGGRTEAVKWAGKPGRRNVAYGVDAFATAAEDFSFERVKELAPPPVEDGAAEPLRHRPWADPAFEQLRRNAPKPWEAFRLKRTDPELFVADDPVLMVGARFAADDKGGRAYADVPWPFDLPKTAADLKQKVWWPDLPEGTVRAANEYDQLERLLLDVRSGDEVLIRHDGPLAVDPVTIKPRGPGAAADFALTVKPYKKCRPVLKFSPELLELDGVLFRLLDGSATFEGLEFQVRAGKRSQMRLRAAVGVVGARACTFRGCVFTLAEDEARAAAVVLTDPALAMAMPGAAGRPVPDVRFEKCFVRGRGRAAWVAESRPFALTAAGTLSALDGPFLAVDPAAQEPTGAAVSHVTLTGCTLVGGPVVELTAGWKAGEPGGLVPTVVAAGRCLFAAVPGAAKPLVDLTGLTPADVGRAGGEKLTWRPGDEPNRYALPDGAVYAAFHPRADDPDTPAKSWDWDQWSSFAGDVGKPVGRVTFRRPPAGLRGLGAVRPADLEVTEVDFPQVPAATPDDAGVGRAAVPIPREE